ncbi:hypothetical protein [Candidatus Vampirococcus lugosii]|uniref:Uncharacterized protein n=1 Tax=Candidatus Vampirococcus lugosii TaxID=2789015 RepID=A0ABS5QL79_9BACT|nr:hypothetical protein [Candidatus Vampirococcus lugosii]MBS8121966.1 hypothetical protein [Candidatus Vampirococcus lugosii]
MTNIKNLQNLYEVNKTVRFELKPYFDEELIKPKYEGNLDENLKKFVEIYEKILSIFPEIVFNFNKEKLNKKLKIKFSFLKNYTKREFYDKNIIFLKKGNNQIEIGESKKLDYLLDRFKSFENDNNFFLGKIKNLGFRNQEDKARNSDLNYFFYQISKITNFNFLKELFNNINIEEAEISKKINDIKEKIKKTEKLIINIEKHLLPKNSGQVIEKASFNYFTVNKKPKNYDKNILEKEKENNKKLNEFTYFNKKERKIKNIFNIYNIKNSGFCKYITSDIGDLEIKRAYELMKEYKTEQKSNFLKYLEAKAKGENIDLNISLYNDIFDKDQYKNILDLTKAILILSTAKSDILNIKKAKNKEQKNEEIKYNLEKYNNEFGEKFGEIEKENFFEKITELKKERGQYFFEGNRKGKFKFYKFKNFCNEYKKIATEYGKIKALIKSIEKEKIEAEKTNSWALILENKNNKYLLTIPRDTKKEISKYKTNLNQSKYFIDNLQNENNGEWILYKFESFTLRALDKLCFGKEVENIHGKLKEVDNSFRKDLYNSFRKEVDDSFRKNLNKNICKYKYKIFFNKGKLKDKFEFKKQNGENDEKLLIDFYKTVLNLESTKKQISIKYFDGFDDFIKKDFENLEKFEEELKKVCYKREKIIISDKTKQEIIENFEAKLYKITNYDLKKYDEEEIKKLETKKEFKREKPNNYTKVWWNFWTEDNEKEKFPIRINPEIKISFIEKDKNFEKKYSGLKFNRKLYDRYILTTSITQNSFNKSIDLNFKETDEILNFYNKYNKDFNKENSFKYFYGLDRGENELVSLGIFDFSKENNKGVKIKVYELNEKGLKATNEKGTPIYKNLSYYTFDTHPDFYDEKEVSCIDLTKAKFINGRIYLNGDLSTYLNLKIASAKRKIYDLVYAKKIKDYKILDDDYNITINCIEKKEFLYYYKENVICSKEEIIEELQEYLNKNKFDENENNISILKINNLRNAICANMVGIIIYLQELYPGMIFFEDFELSKKQNDFEKNNTTLGSRIEEKLLQKFSSLGKVPPNYKQVFSFQSDKKLDQLGIIGYINKYNTSSACPVCNEKLFGHGKGPKFENSMHHYKENNGIDYGNNLKKAKKTENNTCNYHMKNKRHGFDFINSGDDLATYNIAKKGMEYIKKQINS